LFGLDVEALVVALTVEHDERASFAGDAIVDGVRLGFSIVALPISSSAPVAICPYTRAVRE